MSKKGSGSEINEIIRHAERNGASRAKIIDSKDVVVDRRVRLKCTVPLCSAYGRSLMCPPNVMDVDEFSEVLALYSKAILLQIETDVDSSDKSSRSLSGGLCEELDRSTGSAKWKRKLHALVNSVETEAFKKGFYLAAGLTGGECSLCDECVGAEGRDPCRHPFQARPSMEALGIDVIRTCEKAGMPVSLSSSASVKWTGLVLLY
jgi:predicted metal-binding protein